MNMTEIFMLNLMPIFLRNCQQSEKIFSPTYLVRHHKDTLIKRMLSTLQRDSIHDHYRPNPISHVSLSCKCELLTTQREYNSFPARGYMNLHRILVITATDRNGQNLNGHKPKRPQTETATNRNGHRPERPQTETATNRNGHRPEWPQTETATNRNGHKPKRP